MSFYNRNRDSRSRWIAPSRGEDSELEVEEEDQDLHFDDDTLDPDFVLDDHLSPSSSSE